MIPNKIAYHKISFSNNSSQHAAFLVLTTWVAHFFYFRRFGLYEDDYALVSPAMGWSLSNLFDNAETAFLIWPQGRPLNFFLPPLLSFIGSRLGGLQVTYLIAFFIVTLNAILCYRLLKRVSSQSVAIIGALTFCLYPADTTHTFLTHAFHLQPSLSLFLIANHCYLSGKRILSYLSITCALLSYESPFMPFMAIPLLKNKRDAALARELALHIAILLTILFVAYSARISLGEERVAEVGLSISSLAGIAFKLASAVFIGPIVSLGLFAYGPIRTLGYWNMQLMVVFVVFLALFVRLLRGLEIAAPEKTINSTRSMVLDCIAILRTAVRSAGVAKLFLAAVVMLCLAYVLSFTHFPPIARYGRETSVHLAAAFGGSLLFACICAVFLSVANAYRMKSYAIIALATYFSLLMAYRFSIQLDFKQAWENKRAFWSGAVANLPDMADETIVFVLDHNLPKTRYILTNSWADAITLAQIFKFPGDWKNPPRLFVVHHNWTEGVVREGDQFNWEVPTATWVSHREALPNSNVIVLEMERGKLVRRFGSLNVKGQGLELKSKPHGPATTWPRGPLYEYLVEGTHGNDPANAAAQMRQ